MPDRRRHRGPHPEDDRLFAPEVVPQLRAAVSDLSWLRTRGYAEPSAMKIVGDRYQLRARQRTAVGRCACPDDSRRARAERRVSPESSKSRVLHIDGLNVLTTIEVALARGVLLLGRDGCTRDMASFHGNYRLVQETDPAIALMLDTLDAISPIEVRVYIDRPVSNSGRLADAIRRASDQRPTLVVPELSDQVDRDLKSSTGIVATADSAILDAGGPWLNLAREIIDQHRATLPSLWWVDLA